MMPARQVFYGQAILRQVTIGRVKKKLDGYRGNTSNQ